MGPEAGDEARRPTDEGDPLRDGETRVRHGMLREPGYVTIEDALHGEAHPAQRAGVREREERRLVETDPELVEQERRGDERGCEGGDRRRDEARREQRRGAVARQRWVRCAHSGA